jgi:hypothetical protein
MRHAVRPALGLVLTLVGPIVAAQEKYPDAAEITVSTKTHLAAEIGYGGPLGAALTGELLYGLGADVQEDGERVRGVAGLLLQAQGGSGGGKLSLGVGGRARVDSDDFRGAITAGVKLSLARTWGSPAGTEPGVTYLGPELDLSVKHVALTLGTLWRVGGARGDTLLFSWGIGFRL